jgi:hypothetical protein
MHEAAILIGEKQKIDLGLSGIGIDDKHKQLCNQNRMVISNLLNPITQNPPALSNAFLTKRSEEKYQLVILSSDGRDHELNHILMIEL